MTCLVYAGGGFCHVPDTPDQAVFARERVCHDGHLEFVNSEPRREGLSVVVFTRSLGEAGQLSYLRQPRSCLHRKAPSNGSHAYISVGRPKKMPTGTRPQDVPLRVLPRDLQIGG